MTATAGRRGPNDPTRRRRIVAAALEVVAERGVSGTTHRTIAARAGVPLGSMTYYFEGLDEILAEAFSLLAEELGGQFDRALAAAADPDEACEAIADLLCGEVWSSERMVALLELYAYGNHSARVADINRGWMQVSRRSLERHFSPQAARVVDAFVEGWTIHRYFEDRAADRELVLWSLRRLTDRRAGDEAP